MNAKDNSGIALILVLWMLLLLTIIALEFSFAMRQEVNATRNYKEEIDCYFYALSGFQQAVGELIKEASIKPGQEGTAMGDELSGHDAESASEKGEEVQDWRDDQRTIEAKVGRGTVEVMIGNENGKWNLNAIPENTLRALIDQLVEDEVERDIITDSILDWIDDNHDHHFNGVEDDYYESLPRPYPCKDAPFDTVEELLQVKGVTPALLYGCSETSISGDGEEQRGLRKGLVDLVSLFGATNLDINTAQKETLLSAGLSEAQVDEIIAAREKERIKNVGEVLSLPGVPVYASGLPSSGGGTFSIIATGSLPDSAVRRRIKGVVRITPYAEEKYQVLYWADNYPIAENLIAVGHNLWEQEGTGSR